MKDFLEFCSKGKMTKGLNLFAPSNLNLEKAHFNLMDSSQQGNVTWSEFLRFYSCKLIAAKNKVNVLFNKFVLFS
jgi:Ca2+-binding EF-hand superfamily protein